ncbi:MAG: hypothetical protein WCX88_02480 [Patescibacteria group bacterium]
MAFTGFQRVGGKEIEAKERVIGAVAYAVGDVLMRSTTAGTLIAATSSATPNLFTNGGGIVTKATDGVATVAYVEPIDYDAEYFAQTTNNSNVAHNYMLMALTDSNTVNNTGTDDVTNPVFMQTGVVGAAADKKIIGQFVRQIS